MRSARAADRLNRRCARRRGGCQAGRRRRGPPRPRRRQHSAESSLVFGQNRGVVRTYLVGRQGGGTVGPQRFELSLDSRHHGHRGRVVRGEHDEVFVGLRRSRRPVEASAQQRVRAPVDQNRQRLVVQKTPTGLIRPSHPACVGIPDVGLVLLVPHFEVGQAERGQATDFAFEAFARPGSSRRSAGSTGSAGCVPPGRAGRRSGRR